MKLKKRSSAAYLLHSRYNLLMISLCINCIEGAECNFGIITLQYQLASMMCKTKSKFFILQNSGTGTSKCFRSICHQQVLTIAHFQSLAANSCLDYRHAHCHGL